MDCDPPTGLLPDQPPEAVHAVALVDDQVTVDAPPLLIVLGVAEILSFGFAALAETDTVADCAALPPAPVQVNV